MTQPRNASTSRAGRTYTWRGESYWSVTTIIGGGVPKPALLPWGMKAVAEAAVAKRKVLDEMLAACESPEDCAKGEFCGNCDQAVRWLKGLPYAQRDRAGDLGTNVHSAVEAYVLGKPFPKWTAVVRPRMVAFERFLADYEPVFEGSEMSVYNRTQAYAGTLDGIAAIDGRRFLLDTKTGKAVYPETALQLAAYRYAEFVGLPDGSEEQMRPVDACAVVRLADDGYELVEVRADEQVFQAFLYAREVFRWQTEIAKTVILGELHRDPQLTALGAALTKEAAA